MGTSFGQFSQTPAKVGVSSYLFYTLVKCFVMFVLIEAVSGRLIGSNSWNRSVEFLRPICAVRSIFRGCFGCLVIIYLLNYVLVSGRP